ncbi:hypothetical protein [Parvibaculum sp.]|uniref:hypothetical protein n=1 Tax=Parvibaculum sp. TaxID=2024848 RepID=UPI002730F91A|nr:hypothetical protein [Parvibaculum sp.]MDP1626190.1 hypothetical protein [Parvibaculum sp.]MDP2151507.1 hypothetical protein [Parvibaculum sp.]MDP3329163.1 hypothetical protein [Parvibaculum sp.]
MKAKPLVSASLSDIRRDAIVLTGSMSLIATALFGGSGALMKFLQSSIPATATAADHRYRQWVFVLSKAEPMRVAQRVAQEHAEAEEAPRPLVFPQRIPSWRAHLRGDRAYLMPLSLIPPFLAALATGNRLHMIKDPSLRFDAHIPWEASVERGEEFHVVWRDAHGQTARAVTLRRDDGTWRMTRDERREYAAEAHDGGSSESWLEPFLPGRNS